MLEEKQSLRGQPQAVETENRSRPDVPTALMCRQADVVEDYDFDGIRRREVSEEGTTENLLSRRDVEVSTLERALSIVHRGVAVDPVCQDLTVQEIVEHLATSQCGILSKLQVGRYVPSSNGRFAKKFVEENGYCFRVVKSGGQRKRHATDLNKLLRFFGNDKISVVSQARLTQYVEYRRAQPFSKDNTIKKEIELLARVVDAGILEKLVTENNIRLVLRMRSLGFEAQSPTRQEIWRVLTGQELRVVDDVLSSVDDTDFWLLVERETGNRAAQVRRIRWDHVRLSRRGIFVPPKNEKSKKLKRGRGRVMMLSNRLIAGLRAYATHCGLQYDAARDRFVDSSGDVAVVALLPQFAERKCSENTISSEMSDRFRVLIGERLGAASYCLRKTVASVWYHAATRISFDMVRLAKHFGHTVAELERDYADALPSGLRDELLRAEETLKAWLQAQNEMVDEDGENGSASSLPFQRIRRPMLYPTELRAHWDYQTVTKQCDNSKSTCAKFVQNFRIDHIREQPFHRMRTWMPPPLS